MCTVLTDIFLHNIFEILKYTQNKLHCTDFVTRSEKMSLKQMLLQQTVEMVLVQLPRWPGIWPRVNTVELLRGSIVRKSVNKPYLCFLCCSILVSSSLQTSATPADT